MNKVNCINDTLSVIIVNYNTRELTSNCIKDLHFHFQGRIDYEIIVVDNNSNDGSQEYFKNIFGKYEN